MLKLKRSVFKCAAALLTAAVTASMPVCTYADAPIEVNPSNPSVTEGDVQTSVHVDTHDSTGDSNVSAVIGDISSSDTHNALEIIAQDNYTATVTTGSVTDSSSGAAIQIKNGDLNTGSIGGNIDLTVGGDAGGDIGVYSSTVNSGKTTLNITGDVTGYGSLYGKGIDISSKYGGESDLTVAGDITSTYLIGADLSVDGGKTTLNVNGNISGGACGAYLYSVNGGTNKININGYVSGRESIIPGISPSHTGGIHAYSEGGVNNVTVTGDVTGGIDTGIYSNTNAGTSTISVKGNVSGKEAGIEAYSGPNAKTTIKVTGNVTSDNTAIVTGGNSIGSVDIYVDGTVTGSEIGIQDTTGSEAGLNRVSVTAWKITPNEDGWVAGRTDPNTRALVHDENFEKNNISYIIKVEQPKTGATISPSKKQAHEGETVILKIDLDDGYVVKGAYSDEGKSVAMLKDPVTGDYYVVVEKGGGVYLSVTLDKAPPAPKPEPEPEKKSDSSESSNEGSPVVEDYMTYSLNENLAADITEYITLYLMKHPGVEVKAQYVDSIYLTADDLEMILKLARNKAQILHFEADGKKYVMFIPPLDSDQEYNTCLAALNNQPGKKISLTDMAKLLGFRCQEEK